ncbi:MAG: ABC transporter permease [Acidobacteria bacterium]|nr:ABC transporter permease [Acidobacteriota bacterium]
MLRHFLRETASNLWRHRAGTFLSLATITASLFTLSLFLLVVTNLGAVVDRWRGQIQVSVFLADDLPEESLAAVRGILEDSPEVDSFEHVSKDEALARFRRDFAGIGRLSETLPENPLPASFEIRVAEGYRSPEAVSALASRLQGVPGVPMVRYDFEWIRKLQLLIRWVRFGGWGLAALLVLASLVAISNAISLSLFARRAEIEIMRLVGATTGYLQGPFLLEGAVQGGLGAALALGLLYGLVAVFERAGLPFRHPLIDLFPYTFLPAWQRAAVLAGGLLMGLGGSLLSVRRFASL